MASQGRSGAQIANVAVFSRPESYTASLIPGVKEILAQQDGRYQRPDAKGEKRGRPLSWKTVEACEEALNFMAARRGEQSARGPAVGGGRPRGRPPQGASKTPLSQLFNNDMTTSDLSMHSDFLTRDVIPSSRLPNYSATHLRRKADEIGRHRDYEIDIGAVVADLLERPAPTTPPAPQSTAPPPPRTPTPRSVSLQSPRPPHRPPSTSSSPPRSPPVRTCNSTGGSHLRRNSSPSCRNIPDPMWSRRLDRFYVPTAPKSKAVRKQWRNEQIHHPPRPATVGGHYKGYHAEL